MTKLKTKKGDQVIVISGKDRKKQGVAEQVFPKKNRVLVAGVNLVKKHQRARGQKRPGGIIELAKPIHISNVMLWCQNCAKGVRAGYRVEKDNKVRICRSCQAKL